MPGEYSHEHPVTIHHGPMAGKRGDDWEDDARKLEELNAKRIENPMKTPPNDVGSIDKSHAARSQSEEGRFSQSETTTGGDDIKL
ncbi:MAG TPA: hypothetical protein VNT75_11100 [Symbiobacteriaceae bacterium]|nr:hypothetical protein [Symbiobacteriaceae bacterium]